MGKRTDRLGPPCACHGEPRLWNSVPSKKNGGTWICRVKTNARAEARSRAQGRPIQGSPEHRAKMRAKYVGKPHPPDCAHCAKNSGPLNKRWNGDAALYFGAHQRHRKAIAGLPCAFADQTCRGRLHAALRHETPITRLLVDIKSASVYSTNSEDYMPLCASHHTRYDVRFVWPFADRDRTVSHPTA